MLSAAGLAAIQAQPTAVRMAGVPAVAGLSPAQVKIAYGFNQLGNVAGSQAANGAGQTIAIVDAFDDATIKSDLNAFDGKFGLPALQPGQFQVVNQQGGDILPSPSPRGDDWTVETSLDVEWAHAMAPGANILLVEANSDGFNDLLTAVAYAASLSGVSASAPGVSVVSISWGSSEFPQETQLDGYFTTPAGHRNVSFVAAAGDSGPPGLWPAYSPNVLAVGGTHLQTGASGNYRMEIGWNFGGGGYSQFEREPSYQAGVQSSGARTIPDVAYDADPNTGFAVYDSLDPYATAGWDVIGGTSAGTPQWAALLAVANQQRAASGLPALAAADLYQLPIADFHDVTVGFNGFSAGPGYDLVTGRGTPYADRIVHALASPSISSVQASARPVESDLTARALSKLHATRAALDLIAWAAVEQPERRGHGSWFGSPSPSERGS
jgi:subtilase family serine protease